MDESRVAITGSALTPLGTRAGAVPGNEVVDVSVILKPRKPVPSPTQGGPTLTRRELETEYGADPRVIEEIRQFAQEYGLRVVEASAGKRTVKLEGAAEQMSRAFGVQLERYQFEGRDYRGRSGDITVPANLGPSIEAVLGLDNRVQAKAHFRYRDLSVRPGATPGISYSPRQVAQLYDFPLDMDGTGQTIGILELGGGFKTSDLQKYFPSEGVSEPSVTAVSVDGAKNAPTNANSADGEVLLDIEVIGSIAPKAKIVVYFAPNTSQGFQDALTAAVHDAKNNPSVISISWGDSESNWTAQAMNAFDLTAQDAAALGITICVASGDNGSSDGVSDGKNHVDFPASSPHVLACGGTTLDSSNGTITSETVWNDGASGGASGGGFSVQFSLPSWQTADVKPPAALGRGVPDVAGDADPETGYNVLVDGQSIVVGGTSAVAPLWSGLIALVNQKLGKPIGFINPLLYQLPASDKALNDITSGSNGAFSAAPGWDATTGLGSPSGQNLLAALSGSAAATAIS